MNKIKVNINGVEYALKGDEKGEYLKKIAAYVDKKLKNIMEANPMLSVTSAAVLTAINSADETFKMEEAYDEIENEFKTLKQNEKNYSNEISMLKDTIESMKSEIEALKGKDKGVSEKEINLTKENKELKFQLQTAKYKIIELENKFLDSQINLAKSKKSSTNVPCTKKENA